MWVDVEFSGSVSSKCNLTESTYEVPLQQGSVERRSLMKIQVGNTATDAGHNICFPSFPVMVVKQT